MTLEEIFDHGKQAARYLFDVQGEIHPMWIAENKAGEIVPMIVEIVDGRKDEVAEGVRKALKGIGAVRYVSMLEAWCIEPKGKEIPESIKRGAPVSQHPDRREIIAIVAEDKTEGSMSGMFYILRPEIGKPRLSNFKEHPRTEDQEGRFVRMLT